MSDIKQGDKVVRVKGAAPLNSPEFIVLLIVGRRVLIEAPYADASGARRAFTVDIGALQKVEPPAPKAKPGIIYRSRTTCVRGIGTASGRIAFPADGSGFQYSPFNPDIWEEILTA